MNTTSPTTTTQPSPKVRRVRAYPRFRLDHHQRLSAHCAARGITLRQGVDEAMARYLDGDAENGKKVLRQLEKIALAIEAVAKRLEETHLVVEVLAATVGRFLRMWMRVHSATFGSPSSPEAAEDLYRGFAAKVAQYFRGGHRFVHELLGFEHADLAQAGTERR